MSVVNVVVDYREPESLWTAFEEHPNVADVTIDDLETADIIINGVGFERKTPSDFATSMTDRDAHLKNQIAKMQSVFDVPVVLIEGDMRDFDGLSHSRVPAKSLRGFVASLEMKSGARVIFCSNQSRLVDMAVRLAVKYNDDSATSALRIDSAVGLEEPFEKRVYGCVDGIGPKTADALYEAYPRLQDAMSASTADLEAIDGIGSKTAETFRATLFGTTE